MLQDLVAAITNLPAIAQNVVGGAVFAAVLFLGQKIHRFAAARTAKFNRTRRHAYLTDEIAKLNVLEAESLPEQAAFISLLLYRGQRNAVKALIWLTLGLLCGTVLPMFAIAGYVGAIYYLFSALNTLRPPGDVEDVAGKLESLRVERQSLKSKGVES
jgi:hypothetical protein